MPIPAGPARSYNTDLLEGLGMLLAAENLGTWNPTGIYADTDTGIVVGTLSASPDRLIALTGYSVSDDPSLSGSVTGVQAVTRWAGEDPRPTDDLAEAIFDALHGRHGYDLPTGIRVVQSLRRSKTSIGQDSNRRWRVSSNFYLTVHRPSPYRS